MIAAVPPCVLVCGTRTFDDYPILCERLDYFVGDWGPLLVVHGDAAGADELADRWAHFMGHAVRTFPVAAADWRRIGRAAGPVRNDRMARYAAEFARNVCVAFWDGRSPGTRDMIAAAGRYGVPAHTVRYDRIRAVRECRDVPPEFTNFPSPIPTTMKPNRRRGKS